MEHRAEVADGATSVVTKQTTFAPDGSKTVKTVTRTAYLDGSIVTTTKTETIASNPPVEDLDYSKIVPVSMPIATSDAATPEPIRRAAVQKSHPRAYRRTERSGVGSADTSKVRTKEWSGGTPEEVKGKGDQNSDVKSRTNARTQGAIESVGCSEEGQLDCPRRASGVGTCDAESDTKTPTSLFETINSLLSWDTADGGPQSINAERDSSAEATEEEIEVPPRSPSTGSFDVSLNAVQLAATGPEASHAESDQVLEKDSEDPRPKIGADARQCSGHDDKSLLDAAAEMGVGLVPVGAFADATAGQDQAHSKMGQVAVGIFYPVPTIRLNEPNRPRQKEEDEEEWGPEMPPNIGEEGEGRFDNTYDSSNTKGKAVEAPMDDTRGNNLSDKETTSESSSLGDDDPQEKFGCLKGWRRDGHIKHMILYISLIIFSIAWMDVARKHRGLDCDHYSTDCHFFAEMPGLTLFLYLTLCVLFLVESFRLSSTFKYLRSIDTTESVLDFMSKLYEAEPRVVLRIECYHFETRVQCHTDSNGRSYTTTQQVPVVTYTDAEEVDIVAWRDESAPLGYADVRQFQLTKVKLSKTFAGDEGYERQRDAFIAANRNRDVHHNFWVDLLIPGYTSHKMSYFDLSKKPKYLGTVWFVITHLTIMFSLPYRMWVSSITGKVAPNVHKVIMT